MLGDLLREFAVSVKSASGKPDDWQVQADLGAKAFWLGRTANRRVAPALVELLRGSNDHNACFGAKMGLCFAPEPQCLPSLIRMLEHHIPEADPQDSHSALSSERRRGFVADVLRAWTGQEFGLRPEPWQQWYRVAQRKPWELRRCSLSGQFPRREWKLPFLLN